MGTGRRETRRIARAAATVSALTLLSRVSGLFRDAVIGARFGAGSAADAFFVAFRFPYLVRRLVGEGATGMAFVPVLHGAFARRDERSALRALWSLWTVAVPVLLALALLGVVAAPAWVRLFAPGFARDPAKLRLTVDLARWLFPYVLALGLVSVLGAALHVRGRFAVPAASPLILNAGLIAAALWLCPLVDPPIRALAVGVLAAGGAQLALHVWGIRRAGLRLGIAWPLTDPVLRDVAHRLGPAIFGTAAHQLNVFVVTALASALPDGSVSYLWFADRLIEFPAGLIAVALGTASLPSLAAQAARGEVAGLRETVLFTARVATWLVIPASVGLYVLSEPVTGLLFARGQFGAGALAGTAGAVRALVFGLWGIALGRVFVGVLYAVGELRVPVVATASGAAATFVLGALLALHGLVGLPGVPGPGHVGLAAASAAGTTLYGVWVAVAAARRLRVPLVLILGPCALRAAAASVPVALVAGALPAPAPGLPFAVRAGLVAAAVGGGVAAYGLASLLLREPLAIRAVEIARGWAGRRWAG